MDDFFHRHTILRPTREYHLQVFPMIVILDNIRSMHNVGSIFRTADAAGIEKIILCGITPGPLDKYDRPNSRLTKVSLGAEDFVKWEHADSTLDVIDELKKQDPDYEIYAVELHADAINYKQLKRFNRKKSILILGGEVDGLSPEVLSRATRILKIPMLGRKESLNVSVAFGIVAYHFVEDGEK